MHFNRKLTTMLTTKTAPLRFFILNRMLLWKTFTPRRKEDTLHKHGEKIGQDTHLSF